MAQLIKLQNYISRYEWNIYRYPSQYVRLKQDNWKKLHYLWSNQELIPPTNEDEGTITRLEKIKTFMKRKNNREEEEQFDKPKLPTTEKELKQYFLDKLFPFQLRWATSTVSEVSFMDQKYHTDSTLHYFLQRFPDTYLLMYYPIFNIKNAPVDGEVIFISPVGIEIIYLLEDEHNAIYTIQSERTWTKRKDSKEINMLSPLIALKRTEKIVRGILTKYDLSFPVTKTVLSRSNRIDFVSEPYQTNIIDKNRYKSWFEGKRALTSPLKGQQLKAAEQLLNHCQSSSVKRPEWEEDDQSFTIVGEE